MKNVKTLVTSNELNRFINKIEFTDSCWLWTAAVNKRSGRPVFSYKGVSQLAYRVSFLWWVGELINGLEIDHVCENITCVNPDHLKQVTKQENLLKQGRSTLDSCPLGHPKNVYGRVQKGHKYCAACKRLISLVYRRTGSAKNVRYVATAEELKRCLCTT